MITVNGTLNDNYVPITFTMAKNVDKTITIRCITSDFNIYCETCEEKNLKRVMNKYIDKAVTNKLLCKECFFCGNIIWYPMRTCELCSFEDVEAGIYNDMIRTMESWEIVRPINVHKRIEKNKPNPIFLSHYASK